MKCAICKHGETEQGTTTVTLERNQSTLVFKNVPADICEACGKIYISDNVNTELFKQAENELKRGVFLEVLNYTETGA